MTERLNPTVMPADTKKYPRPIRVFTRAALLSTWRSSRDSSRKPGANGIDGLSARRFNQDRDRNFSRIIEDLKKGSYRFSNLRPFFIPKKNGKFRVICVPTVMDRLVQRTIVEHLTKNDRFRLVSKVSYGFIRGRGVQGAINEAIERRSRREWVLKTDIQSFFDEIDRSLLKDNTKRRLRNHSLTPLLCDAVDCEIRVKSDADRKKLHELKVRAGRGLRQGMPLSPLLSNLVLADFDQAAIRGGYDVLRYADDLILFGESRAELEKGFAFFVRELKKAGHSVPEPGEGSKTEFVNPKKPVEFLGMEIVHKETLSRYVCRIPKSVKARILSDIAVENSLEVALRDRETFDSFCRRLSGLPSSYRSAFRQAEDLPEFEPEIVRVCNRALTQVFVDVFGDAAVAALSPDLRRFLGIAPIAEE